MDMLSYWKTLPAPVRNLLLENGECKLQLMKVADAALAKASLDDSGEDSGRLLGLGMEVLLAAWESELLDGETAGQLASLARLRPHQQASLVQEALGVAKSWRRAENPAYYQRLQERGDQDKLWRFLESQAAREPDNLYWPQQSLDLAVSLEDFDRAEAVAGAGSLPVSQGLRFRLLGEIRFLRGDFESALALLRKSHRELPLPGSAILIAQSLLRLGSRESALLMLMDSLKASPWRTNTFLVAHDLAAGADLELSAPAGGVAVLIYTYMKARELDQTLQALFASRLEDALVLALDNGSRDVTAAVLAGWKERVGERLEIVSLPVNVGAPAARNWLMRHESAARSRYVAFLDDDALVPEDWLERLGAAARRYPEAGVWGCRVVDAHQPQVLQSTDLFLEKVPGGTSLRHFQVSSHHLQALDHGQFSYLRPCASVTGCCHLFERSRLLNVGDFDLWFSPSQLDDLDRDIRMVEKGRPAVYQGHLAVRHLKRSGKAVSRNPRDWGNSQGNEAKLQLKHARGEISQSMEQVRGWLWDDLQAKLAAAGENSL